MALAITLICVFGCIIFLLYCCLVAGGRADDEMELVWEAMQEKRERTENAGEGRP